MPHGLKDTQRNKTLEVALQGPERRIKRLVDEKKVRYVIKDGSFPTGFEWKTGLRVDREMTRTRLQSNAVTDLASFL